ncbi:MAG: putative pre6S rRNA nuclease [Verrucomicrobiota bacterium]|jgi:putative Holliday junction resolvase
MRIMALDYGTKRIGVAISDELKMIAQPLEFIAAERFEAVVARLQQLFADKPCKLVVVGLPRNMDGTYGPAADKVRAFVERLKGTLAVPVRTWDERLTSAQANRVLLAANVRRDQRKQKVDAMAAAILLQSFLDSSEANPGLAER